jgi:hypothetical protein
VKLEKYPQHYLLPNTPQYHAIYCQTRPNTTRRLKLQEKLIDEERSVTRSVPPSDSAAASPPSPPPPPSPPSKSTQQPGSAASSSDAEQHSDMSGHAQVVISEEKLAEITEVLTLCACACAAAAA